MKQSHVLFFLPHYYSKSLLLLQSSSSSFTSSPPPLASLFLPNRTMIQHFQRCRDAANRILHGQSHSTRQKVKLPVLSFPNEARRRNERRSLSFVPKVVGYTTYLQLYLKCRLYYRKVKGDNLKTMRVSPINLSIFEILRKESNSIKHDGVKTVLSPKRTTSGRDKGR